MANARDRVYGTVGDVRPYVERAFRDERLRQDVMSAFGTARELYGELLGGRSAATVAARVATDDDVREELRDAVADLRRPADRLQGKKDHTGLNMMRLIAGGALGILFNPITGPETRRWLTDMVG